MSRSGWVGPHVQKAHGGLRLFCFPYAGAGASLYRRMADRFPPSVELVPVQLPGREERLDEGAFAHMDPLVDAASEALEPYVRGRCAFLGYSLGALVAFEVACALRYGARPVESLIVSAAGAPDTFGDDAPVHPPTPDDASLVARLARLGATSRHVLDDEDMMAVLLPTIRADFSVLDTYRPRRGVRLSCPIHAIGGRDDTDISERQLASWRRFSRVPCSARQVPGGHFFMHTNTTAWIDAVTDSLSLPAAQAPRDRAASGRCSPRRTVADVRRPGGHLGS